LTAADNHKSEGKFQADLLLHNANELPAFDIEEWPSVSQRIPAELAAKPHDRRTQPLYGHAVTPELGEQASLDHLAPGDDVATGGLLAKHGVVELAGPLIPFEPTP
jgi:hypothetical protein